MLIRVQQRKENLKVLQVLSTNSSLARSQKKKKAKVLERSGVLRGENETTIYLCKSFKEMKQTVKDLRKWILKI